MGGLLFRGNRAVTRYIPLILTGVLLNSVAQLCLKQGMQTIGYFDFSLRNLLPVGIKIALNPVLLLGMASYAVSIVIWLMVLSRVDVSYAYPMLSVGYLVTALAGKILFGEVVGLTRLSGILLICLGVILISRSG